MFSPYIVLRPITRVKRRSMNRAQVRSVFTTVIFLILGSLFELTAQYTTGAVQGTIYDPSGAIVPNGPIVLRNVGTNIRRTYRAGDAGIFSFAAVPPGTYELSAEAAGFGKSIVRFEAVASQTTTQDIQLGLRGTSATVEVNAGSAVVALDKTDAQLSTNRNALEVNNLPTLHSTTRKKTNTPNVQPMY